MAKVKLKKDGTYKLTMTRDEAVMLTCIMNAGVQIGHPAISGIAQALHDNVTKQRQYVPSGTISMRSA